MQSYYCWSIISIVSIVGCVIIAERRGGKPFVWLFLGLIFGPIAFAVALTAGKQCPHCKLWIPSEAKVCGHCTREV